MSKKIEGADKGFFSMEDVRHIEKMGIAPAKEYAKGRVAAMDGARSSNVKKANEAIDRARNTFELMRTMTNFLLAHPSEGLGMGSSQNAPIPKQSRN